MMQFGGIVYYTNIDCSWGNGRKLLSQGETQPWPTIHLGPWIVGQGWVLPREQLFSTIPE